MKNESQFASLPPCVFSDQQKFSCPLDWAGRLAQRNRRRLHMALLAGSASIAIFASTTGCLANAATATPTSPANQPYTFSFQGGTEVMNFAAHIVGGQPRLFAGIGYWEDNEQYPGAQVYRLDSPTSSWVVDTTFGEKIPGTQTPIWDRVAAMKSCTFNYDGKGNKLASPVTLLVVGCDSINNKTKNPLTVFVRNDSTGTWSPIQVTQKAGGIRSFGMYHSPSTNADYLFVGTNGNGIYRGVYVPPSNNVPGHLSFGTTAVAASPPVDGRVMAFTDNDLSGESGGTGESGATGEYATADPRIYFYDDSKNQWSMVATYLNTGNPMGGVRGIRAMPGGYIMGVLCGKDSESAVEDFLPERQEINISDFFKTTLGPKFIVKGIIGSYNHTPQVTNPTTGEPNWLVGLGFGYGNIWPVASQRDDSFFLARDPKGNWSIHDIPSLGFKNPHGVGGNPGMPQVRCMAVSPFLDDKKQVMYIGFYDCDGKPCHNTGHIFRVGLATALKPYTPPSSTTTAASH